MATTAPISNSISHPTSDLISAFASAKTEVRHFARWCAHGLAWAIVTPALKLISEGMPPEAHEE